MKSDAISGQYPIGIVFGAGIWHGHKPSPVLYDRLVTAAELYKAGHVKKLLLTGDNRFVDYNEPEVMRETLITLGIPDRDLVLDYAGRRTFDSCYRSKMIFGIDKAILVSQSFHLPRALYLCQSLGIDAIGLSADRREYPLSSQLGWFMRESLARLGAFINLFIWHPRPILGDKITIE